MYALDCVESYAPRMTWTNIDVMLSAWFGTERTVLFLRMTWNKVPCLEMSEPHSLPVGHGENLDMGMGGELCFSHDPEQT